MILGGRLCEQSAIALVSDTIIHHKIPSDYALLLSFVGQARLQFARLHSRLVFWEAGWGRGFLALFGAGKRVRVLLLDSTDEFSWLHYRFY